MRDIRFVSGDSESLILENSDGEKYRLTVDSTVRDSIRRQVGSEVENKLTPREIQDSIRTGASIEELVASSGDDTEYVSRFAAPVLEELAHMVASALAVRVEIEPDRFNEVRHREFGDLVTERLRNGGASAITWKASRETPFTWLITASFETMGGVGLATWTFDPRHVVLSPENETAVVLSNSSGFGDSPIPKLQVINTAPAIEHPAAVVESPQNEEPKVTELLDAFKQRREAVAAEVTQEAVAEPISDEEPSPEVIDETEVHEPKQEQPRKGRAPMPSWDEIVFGSKTDD